MAIMNNAFPVPPSLDILEIGNSKDDRTMVYSVSNPHPGYGVDPNIINELGHSIYPKMIYPNGKENPGVIVKNPKEEAEITGKEIEEIKLAGIEDKKNKLMEELETLNKQEEVAKESPWK